MCWAPALHDGRLFVLTRGPGNLVRLHALDPANGERLWVRDEGITASSAGAGQVPNGPTVRDGYVYVASDRGIVACDAATGDVEWTATFGPHVVEREGGPTTKTIWVKPAVTDDRAFTFDENDSYGETRQVYAVDRASGDPEWTAELELGDDWSLRGSVVAGADRVFVAASGGSCGRLHSLDADSPGDANGADDSDDSNCSEPDRLFALDADSGDVDWERSRPEFVGPPAYADGTLYVADLDSDTGQLRALDATSGEATWTYENEDGGVALPAVTDDTVYLNQGSGLAAVDRADGKRRWEVEVEVDSSLGPPVIVGDTVYVPTNPGRGYDSRILAVREP